MIAMRTKTDLRRAYSNGRFLVLDFWFDELQKSPSMERVIQIPGNGKKE
jgi:hypothetical protein